MNSYEPEDFLSDLATLKTNYFKTQDSAKTSLEIIKLTEENHELQRTNNELCQAMKEQYNLVIMQRNNIQALRTEIEKLEALIVKK